ncbi:MAG: ABC transporter ATP-binding protein [Candidatus Hodarchaeales archaeon]
MNYILETKKLTKLFNGFPALDAISLQVPKGINGLVGANGAGKTTLLRILLGILPQTSGDATILGKPINSTEVRQTVGYMSELDSYFPDISAMRYIAHLGQMSGLPRTTALQRAHDILTFVDLGEERHRKIRTFSKGMTQKMKLAQALVHSPKLLLLDEPTDGLDPESRTKMLKLIGKLYREHGINILISTHILPDIQRIGNYLIVIHRGKLMLANKLETFLNRFENTVIVEIEAQKVQRKNFFDLLDSNGLKCRYLTSDRIEIQLNDGKHEEYKLINQSALNEGIRILSIGRHSFTLDEAFLNMFQDDEVMRTGQVPGRGD